MNIIDFHYFFYYFILKFYLMSTPYYNFLPFKKKQIIFLNKIAFNLPMKFFLKNK